MRIEVLGCGGGIGGGMETTSFLLDEDILIDAGTGVGRLQPERMARIRHVFLTHSHLDHIAGLPLLLVSMSERPSHPVVLHGLPETLAALRTHIFNWVIWPDFSVLPEPDGGVLRFQPMAPGEVRTVGARQFELIPVHHVVPAAGYRVESAGKTFAFSGDTTTNDTFWRALNARQRLDLLLVEVAFAEADRELSRLSRHYCPSLLAEDLKKLELRPDLFISHFQPGREERIMAECAAALSGWRPKPLTAGTILHL